MDPMEFHWIQWNSNGSKGIPLEPMEFQFKIGIPIQNWKVGGKSAGPAGPAQTPKNRNFFGHSQMIGGLFRMENQVRSAPKIFLLRAGRPEQKMIFFMIF